MPYDPGDAELAELQVRTTAQTAVGKRLYPDHPGFWSGAEVDLSGAYLIDLRFNGIRVSNLIITGATFGGDVGFDGATFGRAGTQSVDQSGPSDPPGRYSLAEGHEPPGAAGFACVYVVASTC